ncbi:MAG: hypothetical protein IKZ97_01345 [Butyrivibrio sp.]|nr:hypothetical protein [Butyrivibrio sp.]
MASTIIAFLIYAILVAMIFIYNKKRKCANAKYDEMQLQIISSAYKRAYFTLITMLFAVIIIDTNCEDILPPHAMVSFIVWPVAISMLVFLIYSVWHDAFFVARQNKKNYLLFCAGMIILYISLFIRHITHTITGPINALSVGEHALFHDSTDAALGTTFLTLAIVIIIKMIKDKKEAAEDED